MSFRVTATHWEIIISFMEKHPELAKGFINCSSGKDTAWKLWEELTTILNATGLRVRTTKKWQKTWTDFKHILKKKVAEIKSEINSTGGGPPGSGYLSDIEKRILSILGPSFYKGIGRPEKGCSFEKTTLATTVSNPSVYESSFTEMGDSVDFVQCSKEIDSSSRTQVIYLNEELSYLSHEKVPSSNQEQTERFETTPKKRHLEHDYVKSPMRNGPKRVKPSSQRSMEHMYSETLKELKEIKECLKDVTNCAKGIRSALDIIADHLSNK